MRIVSSQTAAALASPGVPLCLLIRMDLTTPLFVSTAGVNVEWDDQLWMGIDQAGSVDQVTDTAGERGPLRFQLSVRNEAIALAMDSANEARGKRCRVYLAVHDPETFEILSAELIWSGTLDQMTLTEGDKAGQVSVTAEHRGVTFGRPKPKRYTNADQQLLYPGDLALQYMTSQANHQDVWPAAEWGRK
jgi:hypothetical protein